VKFSYNRINTHLGTFISLEVMCHALTTIGLEVEGTSPFTTLPIAVQGIIIGKILEITKHPDADKLNLTKVDVGSGKILNIICGANNLEVGQNVPVATVGTTIVPTAGDSFVIKKTKIRGQESEGMICAEDEIGLSDNHEGIMVLPVEYQVGALLSEFIHKYEDTTIEIGLTPNRVDASNHYGVARDLSAYLRIDLKELALENIAESTKDYKVEIQAVQDCPRYCCILFNNVNITESPDWIKNFLSVIGVKSINNIVDLTNFILFDVGQPLHAFDADTVLGSIIVRKAHQNEELLTLDGAVRKLTAQDLVIADEVKPLALAGIMGGYNSRITPQTKRILLEIAYFNPNTIRNSAKYHGLNTDASWRYERGIDPIGITQAAMLSIQNILAISLAKIDSKLMDLIPIPLPDAILIQITTNYINQVIGKELAKEEIIDILQRLKIQVKELDNKLYLTIPHFKVDVTRPIDVVEEVLRIHGLDNVSASSSIAYQIEHTATSARYEKLNQLKQRLSSLGLFESQYLSFGILDTKNPEQIPLLNPMSEELAALYTDPYSPGLKSVIYNQNRKQFDFGLFNIGNFSKLENADYKEVTYLSIWLDGQALQSSHWSKKTETLDFYSVAGLLEFAILGLSSTVRISYAEVEDSVNILNKKKVIGQIRNIASKSEKDLQNDIWYASVNLSVLNLDSANEFEFKRLSKYPFVERDLALTVPAQVKYEEISAIIKGLNIIHLQDLSVFDVYKGKQMDSNKVSVGIRLKFEDKNATLSDKVVDLGISKVIKTLQEKLQITLRA